MQWSDYDVCGGHARTRPCRYGSRISYGPGGGEMLEVTGRGSKAVQMFAALDRETPPGPPDVPKVIRVAGEYGVKFHI